jgi:hypothetical protein
MRSTENIKTVLPEVSRDFLEIIVTLNFFRCDKTPLRVRPSARDVSASHVGLIGKRIAILFISEKIDEHAHAPPKYPGVSGCPASPPALVYHFRKSTYIRNTVISPLKLPVLPVQLCGGFGRGGAVIIPVGQLRLRQNVSCRSRPDRCPELRHDG